MSSLAIIFAAVAAAATPAAPAKAPCKAAEFHQLDFWIGQWNVYEKDTGKKSSTSRIEGVMVGCGIGEHYEEPGDPGGPYSGTSYSSYDRDDGKWHQMYIDTNGSVEWFTGGLVGHDMVMEAPGGARRDDKRGCKWTGPSTPLELDPHGPTVVGGRRVTRTTILARDSSL